MARRTRRLAAGAVLLVARPPGRRRCRRPAVRDRARGGDGRHAARAHRRSADRRRPSCATATAVPATAPPRRSTAPPPAPGAAPGTPASPTGSSPQIEGETHSFSAAAYWGFFLDEAVANLGICGQKLQAGDRVLFAPAPSNFDPIGVLTLEGVPATVAPGTPFTVTVEAHRDRLRPASGLPARSSRRSRSRAPRSRSRAAVRRHHRRRRDSRDHAGRGRPGDASRDEARRRALRGRARLRDHRDGRPLRVGRRPRSRAPPARQPPRPRARRVALIAGVREGARFTRRAAPRTLSGTVASSARPACRTSCCA